MGLSVVVPCGKNKASLLFPESGKKCYFVVINVIQGTELGK